MRCWQQLASRRMSRRIESEGRPPLQRWPRAYPWPRSWQPIGGECPLSGSTTPAHWTHRALARSFCPLRIRVTVLDFYMLMTYSSTCCNLLVTYGALITCGWCFLCLDCHPFKPCLLCIKDQVPAYFAVASGALNGTWLYLTESPLYNFPLHLACHATR